MMGTERERERGWRQANERKRATGMEAGTRRDGNAGGDPRTNTWERGRERGRGGIGEGGGEAKKRKKPQSSRRHDLGNGGDLGGKRKNVDKKGLSGCWGVPQS